MDNPQARRNENRLAQVCSLLAKIQSHRTKANVSPLIRRAKVLKHLLVVSRKEDPSYEDNPDYRAASSLIDDLLANGFNLQPKRISKIRTLTSAEIRMERMLGRLKKETQKQKQQKKKRKKRSQRPWLVFTAFETNRRKH